MKWVALKLVPSSTFKFARGSGCSIDPAGIAQAIRSHLPSQPDGFATKRWKIALAFETEAISVKEHTVIRLATSWVVLLTRTMSPN